MTAQRHRRRALWAKALALAFWLVAWAFLFVGVRWTIGYVVSLTDAEWMSSLSKFQQAFFSYGSAVGFLSFYLAGACFLLAVSRGILWLYEALGHLRKMAGERGPATAQNCRGV